MVNSYHLKGHFLVAMPDMQDERFKKAVIYICSHSADGAMGIVINQPAPELSFSEILIQLNITPVKENITLPAFGQKQETPVFCGGPVEPNRGFILHSPDYYIERTTVKIEDQICLTATLDILRAFAEGRGPQYCLFALGYAGWGAGQLEHELQDGGWLNCESDADVLFHMESSERYSAALKSIGIDPEKLSQLSYSMGHA